MISAKSDVGKVRTENQDEFFETLFDDGSAFAVVCDGMGGVKYGGEASKAAIAKITKRILKGYNESLDSNSIRNLLITALDASNTSVYSKSVEIGELANMGTTCVCALVKNKIAHIANVGDSRAYRLSKDGVTQLTVDHTVVQMLLNEDKITPEEAKNHYMKNVLVRAIGINPTVDIDYFEVELDEGDEILLCSDGLTDYYSEELLHGTVWNRDPQEVCNYLTDYVSNNGGQDNVTIVIISDIR